MTTLALVVPGLRGLAGFSASLAFYVPRGWRVGLDLSELSAHSITMRAWGASMSRRGFGYVVALTVIVTMSGAAGMYAFENGSPDGLNSYGEALWWTAMIMTTMGSAYWPQTPEGRVFCIILALYAFWDFWLRDRDAGRLLRGPRCRSGKEN